MGAEIKSKFSFISYIKIIRPIDDIVVGLIAIIAVILGGSITRDMDFLTYVYIMFAGFFLSAHAMVVNDIIDYDIDLINEPKRMLPSGALTRNAAKIYSILLGIAGITSAYLIDLTDDIKIHYSWFWAIVHLFLADFYNFKLKKTGFLGNLVVAYTSLASFLYGDLFFNDRLTILPFTFGIIAFMGNLSREILKGIIDVEGDALYSVKTIAVKFSPAIAQKISISLLIVSMSLTSIIFGKLMIIGQFGIVVFIANLSYALKFVSHSSKPHMARKGKHLMLLGPLLLIPFLLVDQILTA
ncbi:MAG: UbiA family prenyltransferase [Candidatus Kariarchaeaceae archaeon]|jgi:geranylgeranylglycerol-phosphate geranylgeranyltransferase